MKNKFRFRDTEMYVDAAFLESEENPNDKTGYLYLKFYPVYMGKVSQWTPVDVVLEKEDYHFMARHYGALLRLMKEEVGKKLNELKEEISKKFTGLFSKKIESIELFFNGGGIIDFNCVTTNKKFNEKIKDFVVQKITSLNLPPMRSRDISCCICSNEKDSKLRFVTTAAFTEKKDAEEYCKENNAVIVMDDHIFDLYVDWYLKEDESIF